LIDKRTTPGVQNLPKPLKTAVVQKRSADLPS
jgi:hypothetical protein